jgi:hypothetical protein
MNRKPLYTALVLTALLLALHVYALNTYFYWHHRWFDIPMHILGGAAIGAFLLAFFNVRRTILYFSCILAVTVGWEIFENVNHISTGQPGYWLDTIKDIVDGFIGAGITFYIAKR